jgi:uncharacterized phage protein (TIGR02218 family)
MTFASDEMSVQDSQPIELYKFNVPGVAANYYYTNARKGATYLGNDYAPVAALQRSPIEIPTIDDPQDLVIDLPCNDAFIQSYALQVPSQGIHATLYRWQTLSAAALQLWSGEVASFSNKGRTTQVRVTSLLGKLAGLSIPNRYFGRQCQNVFADEGCTLDAGDWGDSTTVSSHTGKTVVVGALTAGATYRLGRILRQTDGEWRWIVAASGTTLTIDYPFRALSNGDTVQVIRGCDRFVRTCRDQYSNVANFRGHPNVPDRDIFRLGFHGFDDIFGH